MCGYEQLHQKGDRLIMAEVVQEFSFLKQYDIDITEDNQKVISFKCWNDYNRKMIFNSFLQLQRGQKFNLSSRVHPWKERVPWTREQPIKSGK